MRQLLLTRVMPSTEPLARHKLPNRLRHDPLHDERLEDGVDYLKVGNSELVTRNYAVGCWYETMAPDVQNDFYYKAVAVRLTRLGV